MILIEVAILIFHVNITSTFITTDIFSVIIINDIRVSTKKIGIVNVHIRTIYGFRYECLLKTKNPLKIFEFF